MAWLTLTDASGRDICVNMDCVMQFDPYHSQSGTETLLILTAAWTGLKSGEATMPTEMISRAVKLTNLAVATVVRALVVA